MFVYIEQPTATEGFNTSDPALSQWNVRHGISLMFRGKCDLLTHRCQHTQLSSGTVPYQQRMASSIGFSCPGSSGSGALLPGRFLIWCSYHIGPLAYWQDTSTEQFDMLSFFKMSTLASELLDQPAHRWLASRICL